MTAASVLHRVYDSPSGHLLGLWFVALGCVAMWSPRTTVVMVVVAAVLLSVLRLVKRPPVRIPPDCIVIFLATIGLITLGALWSKADTALFQAGQLLGLAVPSALVIALVHGLQKTDLSIARSGLIAGGAAFAVLMTFELLSGQAVYRAIRDIGPEVTLDPNALNRPEVLAALFIWPVSAACWQLGWRKVAICFPLSYAAVSLTLTSQSTVLGMSLGIFVFALSAWRWRVIRWLLVGAIVTGFLLAVPAATWMAKGGLDQVSWLDFSAKHRVLIWDYVANRIWEHPFFGWGLDASRVLNEIGGSLEDRPSVELLPLHPHNAMLQIWLELGAYGVLISLIFVLGMIGQIDRIPSNVRPFAAGLFASAVGIASAAYGVWQTWWLAGILSAVAGMVVVAQMDRAERSKL